MPDASSPKLRPAAARPAEVIAAAQNGAPGTHDASPDSGGSLSQIGDELVSSFSDILAEMPDLGTGPMLLARRTGIDKVLASRILRAVQARDPLSALHAMPGPSPLRRALRAFSRQGADAERIRRAAAAIDRFESLLNRQAGGRGSLDTLLAAWVPEARAEFELRRKQSAFRATSQLKGVEARLLMGTVFLHPADDGEHLDVVWLTGLHGLHRLRPGALVRLATRRVATGQEARLPRGLDGRAISEGATPLISEFCTSPCPTVAATRTGDVVHYTLDDDRFGAASAVDLVLGEANFNEMERRPAEGSGRVPWFFAEVSTPAKVLQFDAIVHRDVYPGIAPSLRLYETAFEGVASPNNPARDVDVLDMLETAEAMGSGLSRWRSRDSARYTELLTHSLATLNWDPAHFRAYRCRIEYPIFGTQVTMTFGEPIRPTPTPAPASI